MVLDSWVMIIQLVYLMVVTSLMLLVLIMVVGLGSILMEHSIMVQLMEDLMVHQVQYYLH